jgi:outer membrane lipoprotein SlyB
MSAPNTKMNPLMATAAVAIIIFSAVGVGVMTGIIPSSKSANDSLTPAEARIAPAPEVKAAPAPVHKPAAQVAHKRTPERPAQVAMSESAAAPVPRICTECGVIDTINVVDKKGEGSGVGAVGGAVVGGLVGNQIGNGRGNTVATVAGALGGAFAGNEVEKRVKSVKEYQVTVRMEDGNTRSFTLDGAPGYAVGDKVKVIDGRLVKG